LSLSAMANVSLAWRCFGPHVLQGVRQAFEPPVLHGAVGGVPGPARELAFDYLARRHSGRPAVLACLLAQELNQLVGVHRGVKQIKMTSLTSL
jgi:hypothetical protein